MGFGALRSVVRPLTRALLLPHTTSPATAIFAPAAIKSELVRFSWLPISNRLYNSLTDTRLPKRRPSNRSRRKRASLRPPGPYKMVDYVPGEPIVAKPNEGSVKRRNEKKRIRMRRAFILEEKLKRKAERQAAERRKREQKVERKMAKVARQRAWVVRLAELKRLEEEKKSNTITIA